MSAFAGMEDILREFLVESHENLDRLDQQFVVLEERPDDRETLAGIFRTIHTIKGTSGFFGLARLERLTHTGENLLSLLRDGRRALTPEITTTLLDMVDTVRSLLRSLEETESEGSTEVEHLVAALTRHIEDTAADASGAGDAKGPAAGIAPAMGRLLVESGATGEAELGEALQQQADGDPRHVGEILVERGAVPPEAVRAALDRQEGRPREGGVADSTLRVEVANLDRLMNLAGELVLVRNQLLQYSARVVDAAFNPILQRLNIITTELQEGVMKTRMQPIGNLWSRFPRIVRDLAVTCGKQVRLEMEGKETELDKTILEAIKDPLTHMMRNAVDHGVETPAERAAAGKPAEGVVGIRARHEGGQVIIEICDDGRGLDVEAIRRKAVERHLVGAEAAGRMSERELVNLIFSPGFSMAREVTHVSGRGVGMDVVRTNITRIGGTVEMQSERGRGSRLKLKIPLTLAVIPALIVKIDGQRFAVPQVNLLELVRLEGEQTRRGIEMIHGAPVHRLRGRLLPLVYLRAQLGLPPAPDAGKVSIVVLQAEGRPFGLVVDEITDTEEIVVKPLWAAIKELHIYTGATIMGDGSVALILDVLGLARLSGVAGEHGHGRVAVPATPAEDGGGEREALLLFRVGDCRMAVPLGEIDRLEELPSARVERAGDQEVVQHRGRILPLLRPADHLPERRGERRGDAAAGGETLQVVVFSHEGGSYGLVVDGIDDIVREAIKVRHQPTREGVNGVVVVREHITELLDLKRLARRIG